ncbi:hypothetical protein BJY00DRAFT_315060 [Aspergillus carlsbadensis]|nr:hypothetical protein BJY00DRAFT_315060 [Aspergillus carlsbadensis]
MEATASYLERPLKRKRESSCSRSGPQSRFHTEPPASDEKVVSAAESFRPLARELERLGEKDPILAAQAARLVALYRRFLSEEKRQAERRSLEYDVLLSYYKEAHQKIEEGNIWVLEDWKEPLVNSADVGKQKQDGSE